MSDQSCIFCKIVRGEIPMHEKLYETPETVAFLDIKPVNAGHTLVLPKEHSSDIFDINERDWNALMETVRLVSPAVLRGTRASGVNLIMNNRPPSGQLVEHAHVHIIPRHEGDGVKHWPQHPYKEGEAVAIAQKIRDAL